MLVKSRLVVVEYYRNMCSYFAVNFRLLFTWFVTVVGTAATNTSS